MTTLKDCGAVLGAVAASLAENARPAEDPV
jgi:hypothetical protein